MLRFGNRFAWGRTGFAVLLLIGPAAQGSFAAEPPAAVPTPPVAFPEPPGLASQVSFWKDVFSTHGLGRVIVHDMDHLELVYDVVDLPGERKDSYTEEQEEFVEDLREAWEERLKSLEKGVREGRDLTVEEKTLALRITETLGSERIAGSHRRVRTQRGLRERFRRGIEIGNRYEAVFREIFRKAGVPEDLAYLPHVESSFQVSARSSAGAAGVWQFTRSTGRRFLAINYAVDERLDPVLAARAAARYIRDAHAKLGDWTLALTSYNHGVNGMVRARQRFGNDIVRIVRGYDGRTFGFASRNFYPEFLAARHIAREPERYFPEGLNPEPPLDLEEQVLDRRSSPARIARTYGVDLARLAELNPAWSRRALYGGLHIPAGSSIWLPAGSIRRLASGKVPAADLSLPGLSAVDFHVVRPGETLSGIAGRYGLTLSSLRRLNGMAAGESLIYAGEKLIVSQDAGGATGADGVLIHVVARGENPTLIAQGYGVSLRELLAANRLNRRSVIYPGQKLKVPVD